MILTIRTDRPKAEVGLFNGQNQLTYKTWPAHRQLAKTLHHKIAQLLRSQGKKLKNIEGIVVYQGPGSFTGLRIGLTIANALAYSLDVPLAGVTGKAWTEDGLAILHSGMGTAYVLPEYGAPVHITQPKK